MSKKIAHPNVNLFDAGATLYLLNNGDINGNKDKFEVRHFTKNKS